MKVAVSFWYKAQFFRGMVSVHGQPTVLTVMKALQRKYGRPADLHDFQALTPKPLARRKERKE